MKTTELSERIRIERERRGISRQEMAEMLHVKASTVWRWEAGRFDIKMRDLKAMGMIFDLTVSELIGETNDQDRS